MKYLIVTKEKDYISRGYKSVTKQLGIKCQVYDTNGILVYPHAFYDGEPRQWAIKFLKDHKVGDSINDARTYR